MFEIGDQVALINEASSGKVIAVLNKKQLLVLLDDGIEIPVSIEEVVKVMDFKPTIPVAISKNKADPSLTKNFKKSISATSPSFLEQHRKPNGNIEVDLHAEELLADHSRMSNGEILNYQLNYFQKCLDEAIVKRLYKIIFIHGVGNGVLRKEIHKILQAAGHEFYDASLSRFGFGATTAILK